MFPNLGIASFIVLLRVGIVWAVLPKVIVTVQVVHVILSCIGSGFFDLLVGWFFLACCVHLLEYLQDLLDALYHFGLAVIFQNPVPFPKFWDIVGDYLANYLVLG